MTIGVKPVIYIFYSQLIYNQYYIYTVIFSNVDIVYITLY